MAVAGGSAALLPSFNRKALQQVEIHSVIKRQMATKKTNCRIIWQGVPSPEVALNLLHHWCKTLACDANIKYTKMYQQDPSKIYSKSISISPCQTITPARALQTVCVADAFFKTTLCYLYSHIQLSEPKDQLCPQGKKKYF